MIHRRNFLSLLAAPAIVHAGNIMPVRLFDYSDPWVSFQSWPLGQAVPFPEFPCVSGSDLLSRARKICTLTSGHFYIRPTEREA